MTKTVHLIFYYVPFTIKKGENPHLFALTVKQPGDKLLIPGAREVGRVTQEVEVEE